MTNIAPTILFPGFTTTGNVAAASDPTYGSYANLNGGSLTTQPFSLDASAQTASVMVDGLASSGDNYQVNVLSGVGYASSTQVAYGGVAPGSWQQITFTVGPWAGQQIEIQVSQVTYAIGVTDIGVPAVAVPNWSFTGSASEASGGPAGTYASLTGGNLTSNPFTLAPSVQQLSLRYAGGATNDEFQVLLLSGQGYTTQTNLSGGYI